jgi:hypothetical protein
MNISISGNTTMVLRKANIEQIERSMFDVCPFSVRYSMLLCKEHSAWRIA